MVTRGAGVATAIGVVAEIVAAAAVDARTVL
jgi:hypothetical protein